MTLDETLRALAALPDDAQISVTVRKHDLVRALETRAGGPQTMTTREASKHLGYRPANWRKWAEEGRIPGARQDANKGPWRLPRPACEALLRELARRSSHRPASPQSPPPSLGSKPRGPRPPKKLRPASDLAVDRPALAGERPLGLVRARGRGAEGHAQAAAPAQAS